MGLSPRNNKNKKKRKKKSFWKSIAAGLIPSKGDSTVEVARKVVFLIALAVLVTAVILITVYYMQYLRLEQNAAVDENGNATALDGYIYDLKNKTPTKQDIENLPEGTVNEEFAALYSENKDFIGWLTVPGTNINEPVVQTDNNEDYIHTNFQGKYEFSGTLFADYEGKISPEGMPHNTIIYGHNMLMKYKFSALQSYKKNIEFLRVSPLIEFDTLYHNNNYKIISVFLTNISEDHGDVFPYTEYVYFSNKSEFYNFVLNCMDRSMYETGVDVEYGDEFLTLSTCDQDTGMDLRLVVVARKVRDNESPDVDSAKILKKNSVKYFDVYEDIFGQKWYGRTWDTGLVKGLDDYIAQNGLEDDPENY